MCGGGATSHASQSGFAPVQGDIIAVTFVSGPRIIKARHERKAKSARVPRCRASGAATAKRHQCLSGQCPTAVE